MVEVDTSFLVGANRCTCVGYNSDGLLSGLCIITCSSFLGKKMKEMEKKTRRSIRQRAAQTQSTSESVLSSHVQKSTGQVLLRKSKKEGPAQTESGLVTGQVCCAMDRR